MFCSGRSIWDENQWGQKAEWKAHAEILVSPKQVGAASCLMPRSVKLKGEWKCRWIQLLVEGIGWYFLWNKESRGFQWLVWDCHQAFWFSSFPVLLERNIQVDLHLWDRTQKTLKNLVMFYSWQCWLYSPNFPDEIPPTARHIIVAIT